MNEPTLEAARLFSLAGRKALITGASGFLGRTMARTLLANGATVLAVGQSERFDEFCEKIRSDFGANAITPYHVNLEDPKLFAIKMQEIVAKEGCIPIAVNNAHSLGLKTGFNSDFGTLDQASIQQIEANLACGVLWPLIVAQALGPGMKQNGGGSIINIASMYAVVAPSPTLYKDTSYLNPPGYSAAKAAMLALTRYTASFWGTYGIRCNAILPGAFPNVESATENSVSDGHFFIDRLAARTCLGRVGTPSDLAGALLYLASDASSYMTGQALLVDGGWTIT